MNSNTKSYDSILLTQACVMLTAAMQNKEAIKRYEQAHSQVAYKKAWNALKPRAKNILVR